MVYLLRDRKEQEAKLHALAKAWNLPKADIMAIAVEVLWEAREEGELNWDHRRRVMLTRPMSKKERLLELIKQKKEKLDGAKTDKKGHL